MVEINNKTRTKINEREIKRVVTVFLDYYKMTDKDVSIAFVGDITMKRLNTKYRQKEAVTDILSFGGEGEMLGEIIIDLAQIKRQAKNYSPTSKDELIFILVHGLLHLLGYDDKTKKGREGMIKLGEEFIRRKI